MKERLRSWTQVSQNDLPLQGLGYAKNTFSSLFPFLLFFFPSQDRSSTPDVIVLGAAAVCLFEEKKSKKDQRNSSTIRVAVLDPASS
jgi:hypothetical protein